MSEKKQDKTQETAAISQGQTKAKSGSPRADKSAKNEDRTRNLEFLCYTPDTDEPEDAVIEDLTLDDSLFDEPVKNKGEEILSDTVFEDDILIDISYNPELIPEDPNAGVHAESVSDGLALSLSLKGRVDLDYIALLTGESPDNVAIALRGKIFEDPARGNRWVTADEYLSGNISLKLKTAKSKNKKGRYDENVKALTELLPPEMQTDSIFVTLGSPWVPTEIIDAFIEYLIGEKIRYSERPKYAVRHDPITGIWEIPEKTRYNLSKHSFKNRTTYGTSRMPFLYLLENTLNMKTIIVTDEVPDKLNKKKTIRTVNRVETTLATERQNKLYDKFSKWIWADEKRAEKLREVYTERYGCIKKTHFDGSFLTLPTMNPDIKLFPYQKDAVARMLFAPNTLLAHDVGSGKTFAMIAAGMELRRMGISKKNLYVVPNNLVRQWDGLFKRLYPTANVMVVDSRSFTPAKKENTLKEIRDTDCDAIVMAYSCFDRIPLSKEYYEDYFNEEAEELKKSESIFVSKSIIERKHRSLSSDYKKVMEKSKELGEKYANTKLSTAGDPILSSDSDVFLPLTPYDELKQHPDDAEDTVNPEENADTNKKPKPICFDDLGINRLFVDEAHNYKNVPIDSAIERVHGISKNGSKKCRDMLDKVRHVQKTNDGGGVIFATGTPITNSITDIYIMQKYLQNGELSLMGLSEFDSWVGMFSEKESNFEVDIDTSHFRMATRFSRFHNLTELTAILSSIADFHKVNPEENSIPTMDGYSDVTMKPTPEFKEYLEYISERADDVRSRRVPRVDDNMLKITGDGRKAALDLRLIDEQCDEGNSTKAQKCADAVYSIYHKTMESKGTQIIFCDTSTPKPQFNMYHELKRLLVAKGVPDHEIAFIHDAGESDKKREKVFAATRSGEIRILLGSTFKLGMGVNVQDRLIAIHHLDVPWRPADMVQREGRILRQGNKNKKVFIYRYITEGSFDAYSWQLLETKQRFIEQLLEGSLNERAGDDVDRTSLSYAEVKALAIGNPKIKERVELANELGKTYLLKRSDDDNRERMRATLATLPERIANQKERDDKCTADMAVYKAEKVVMTPEEAKEIKEQIETAIKKNSLSPYETELMTYQGFKIMLPPYIQPDSPFVNLVRNGRYYVQLGAEQGFKRRIDNFLDNLSEQKEKFRTVLKSLREQQINLTAELEKPSPYGDRIAELRERLNQIDNELGVEAEAD